MYIKRPLCENAEQEFKRCSIGFWLEQTQQAVDLHAHMVCFYSLHINIYMYVRACLGLVGLVNGDLDQFLKCDHTYDGTYMCIHSDYTGRKRFLIG